MDYETYRNDVLDAVVGIEIDDISEEFAEEIYMKPNEQIIKQKFEIGWEFYQTAHWLVDGY